MASYFRVRHLHASSVTISALALLPLLPLLSACDSAGADTANNNNNAAAQVSLAAQPNAASSGSTNGQTVVVSDTSIMNHFSAAGVATAIEEATVGTTLMGTVTDVLVREGDRVRSGQLLLKLDAAELDARAQRLAAAVSDAEAMHSEALIQARRFESLYSDSAATRAQYEAATTALARAEAGVNAARAAARELDAVTRYSELRAPFDGVVIRRNIDRGGLAAPGAPLLVIQNSSTLRLKAAAPIEASRSLARGQRINVSLDGVPAIATVEGVVPAGSSNLFTVNALVENTAGRHAAGSSATLDLPTDSTRAILLPERALIRDGDMVGVIVDRDGAGSGERRWIRLGATHGDQVEVTSGLKVGDRVFVPARATAAVQAGVPGAVSVGVPHE